MLKPPWVHTEPQRPCPICGRSKRGNRCILIPDDVVLCYYAISNRPRKTTAGDCWMHSLKDGWRQLVRPASPAPAMPPAERLRRNDLHLLAQKFHTGCSPARLDMLSRHLGLSIEALKQLEVGWCDGVAMTPGARPTYAFSFPRRSPDDRVIGLSMRALRPGHDAKFSFTGSGGGLHIPRNFTGGGDAFVVEGPTDTGAAVDLRLNVFGRMNNASEPGLVVQFAKLQHIQRLIIFSQRDEAHYRKDGSVYFPAQDGAEELAALARLEVPEVRVIMPPECQGDKDVRDWKKRGATRADVERLVTEAMPRRVSVTVEIRKKGNGVCRKRTITI